MNANRMLKVAAVQVESRNGDVEGNLQRAQRQVALAAAQGAQLVLCPELLATGYTYHRSIWNAAEPSGGPTEAWLRRMALQHGLYIGATYLQADGNDFFNTFTLIRPDGCVAGRVRKQSLPGFEGCFFRSCPASKTIETEFGRVGVGICWDNNTARFMQQMSQADVDLLLMPHSAARIWLGPFGLVGDAAYEMLQSVAGYFANTLGVPTVMANKAKGAVTWSPVPYLPCVRLRMRFLGGSTICNSDGATLCRLNDEEGLALADVQLDPARKQRPTIGSSGYWSRPPRGFPRTKAALKRILEGCCQASYGVSRSRRLAASACIPCQTNDDSTLGAGNECLRVNSVRGA